MKDEREKTLEILDDCIARLENCSEDIWGSLTSNENSDSTKFTIIGYRIKMIDEEVEKLKDLRDVFLIGTNA